MADYVITHEEHTGWFKVRNSKTGKDVYLAHTYEQAEAWVRKQEEEKGCDILLQS
jgi:hypothetical protein